MKRPALYLTVTALVCAAAPALVAASDALGRDPANVYGQFENGLHYIIRRNTVPPGKVALYLHVDTGALNETDQQNGLAHFLEHMCFNGSTHFAPGELIPHMNRMGMQFGAHSNAHTNFSETVYKLFMPDNKPETITTALTIFGDWANGLLLLQDEIDKERGIILEEARTRKGPEERIFDQFRRRVLAGSRLAVHDIIGDEEQIKTFDRATFQDYWNTWYRPERMTFIVVGDIEPQTFIAQALPVLGQFKARATARPSNSANVRSAEHHRAFVFTDEEMVGGRLQVMAIDPARPPMATVADYHLDTVENIGTWIVNRRLQDLVQRGEAAFRGAFTAVQPLFNEALMPSAGAIGEPEDWPRMLEQVVIELDRAIEHGFTAHELDLARKDLIAGAERQVEVETTHDNSVWVNYLSGAIGSKRPILSAKQNLDLMRRVCDSTTVEEVHRVFVSNFGAKTLNYVLTAPQTKAGFTLPEPEDLIAAAAAAWARKTTPLAETAGGDTLLSALPEPGGIIRRITDEALGITTVELENGIVVHHRYMDYKKDNVMVSITLAGGTIEETAANRGVTDVAGLAEATSRLSSVQIRDLMTGKKISVTGGGGIDSFSVRITGSPADLEVGFQQAYAIMTDGRIEAAALSNWKKGMLQSLEQMIKTPNGQLRLLQERVLFGGDPRLAVLTAPQIEQRTAEEGQAWLRRIVDQAAIEVAIVGDIPLEPALGLIARYLGSLPQRSPGDQLTDLRKLQRGAGPFHGRTDFESITPMAVVLAGFVGADERELADHRKLTLAAMVLSDRMIRRLREEERLVYGIGARHQPGSIPGMGLMMAAAPTDPGNADRLADTIQEMFADFAANGPTAEELDVARRQIANVLEERMKEPQFWLNQLADMRYRGHTLDDLKVLPGVYQTFSAEELRDAVRKYNRPDRTVRLVAVPKSEPAAVPVPAGQPVELEGVTP